MRAVPAPKSQLKHLISYTTSQVQKFHPSSLQVRKMGSVRLWGKTASLPGMFPQWLDLGQSVEAPLTGLHPRAWSAYSCSSSGPSNLLRLSFPTSDTDWILQAGFPLSKLVRHRVGSNANPALLVLLSKNVWFPQNSGKVGWTAHHSLTDTTYTQTCAVYVETCKQNA